jgi:hypothetical protein
MRLRRQRTWIAIAAVASIVAAGAGYGLFFYPDHVIRAAFDDMARKLPSRVTFSYKDAHYSILHQTLTLSGLYIHIALDGASEAAASSRRPSPKDAATDTVATGTEAADTATPAKAATNPVAADAAPVAAAAKGTAAKGTAASGTASDTAASDTAASGTATSDTASGTAATGTAASDTASDTALAAKATMGTAIATKAATSAAATDTAPRKGPDAIEAAPNGVTIAIDSLTMEHPATDTAALLARSQADPGSVTPDTRIPVADALVLTGIRLSTDAAPHLLSTTEWLALRGISLYPWILLHQGLPALTAMQAAMTAVAPAGSASAASPAASGRVPADGLPLMQVYAAMLWATRYDAYNERNLTVTLPGPPGTALAGMPIVLSTLKLDASYDRGIQSHGTLDGFSARLGKFGHFTSAHIDLPDFDTSETMQGLIDGESLGPMAEKMAIGPLRFSGVAVTPPGQAGAVPIGGLVLSNLRFEHGRLVSGGLAMAEAPITNTQACTLLGTVACGGAPLPPHMTWHWRASFARDSARDQLSIFDTDATIDPVGQAGLDLALIDVARGEALMSAARVAHAELRLQGDALVRQVGALGMQPGDTDPGAPWRRLVSAAADPPDSLDTARTQPGRAGSDDAGPRDVTIRLAPSVPIPLDQLREDLTGSAPLPAEFGITVSAGHP